MLRKIGTKERPEAYISARYDSMLRRFGSTIHCQAYYRGLVKQQVIY